MKKLIIFALMSFNLNAAELIYNNEFNEFGPIVNGVRLPLGFQVKSTGAAGSYTVGYPTYDSSGTYYALKMSNLSNAQTWLAEPGIYRIPVSAGSTYRYTVRAKCDNVMNAKIEHYNGATLLKHEILAAPTIADQLWHTIIKDFVVPAGTNKISIGPHSNNYEWCNIGMVSLQKLN